MEALELLSSMCKASFQPDRGDAREEQPGETLAMEAKEKGTLFDGNVGVEMVGFEMVGFLV